MPLCLGASYGTISVVPSIEAQVLVDEYTRDKQWELLIPSMHFVTSGVGRSPCLGVHKDHAEQFVWHHCPFRPFSRRTDGPKLPK